MMRLCRYVLVGALLAPLLGVAPASAACANPIVCENQRPGLPESEWKVAGSGDPALQGYATRQSIAPGGRLSLKVDGAMPYHVDILRVGWYRGDGARLVATVPATPRTQPPCAVATDGTGLVDCTAWSVTASWLAPAAAVSGVYVAHLVREDTRFGSLVPFVVREATPRSAVVVQTSDETWQAYNTYGGNSLYQCAQACPPGDPHAYKGASKVSYDRPLNVNGSNDLFASEYQLIRFVEESGLDVSYLSGYDVASRPAAVRGHRVFVSSGHDEYWSRTQRENVWAARDAGTNLAFLSGNEIFWKTRFERAGRTLVCYKDTHYDARTDPVEWTGTWRDPRFRPPAEVVAENALTGQLFAVNTGTGAIEVPARFRGQPIWRHTRVAQLADGATATLAPGTLGYEWDVDGDPASSIVPGGAPDPPGLTWLSETTLPDVEVFVDYGSTVEAHHAATHHLSLYRAPSGALVFGAGTVQWSWGLAGDQAMRQATVNMFIDMGASPATPPADVIA